MAINFGGKTYLIGPVLPQKTLPLSFHDIGTVQYMNNNCTVLKSFQANKLVIKVQRLNTEWPDFHELRTQADLLKEWH